MTTDEFFAWCDGLPDSERYELVEGEPVRLQSERIRHAESKASAWLALRTAIRSRGLDCHAFIDGVSVRIDDHTVREPDALVHCGPYDPDDIIATNPVVVVEVASPSTFKTDAGRKLLDYFVLPSICHYLILAPEQARVVHHRRSSIEGEILTRILGREATVDLSPPGIVVSVDALLGA
ncbi:Uma2 family endonuclease [Aurantimonas sp. VKM B-3413]|uniref:Uma2 family endonuclease n=1 Tax=Aurantimonas sp. VKM B-3413 TaxID=2779401 RepID=UPI001E4293EA|nr:Uma2 family endonuclease [Aurantimonas sp. VKM B-3413]MCB8838507.1 Uma2 family endonuclease [Aurantimonas sp. VKM B-3413]